MSFDSAVCLSALALAWLSFFAFLFFTAKQLHARKHANAKMNSAHAGTPAAKSVVDRHLGRLLESAARLIDTLASAGPGLPALGASVLFFSIALYSVNRAEVSSSPRPVGSESARLAVPGK
jgi:hypothetical protein